MLHVNRRLFLVNTSLRRTCVVVYLVLQGRHGIRVHVFGDFSEGLVSAGGIFNPFSKNHGAPDDEDRMVGDLGELCSVSQVCM